jgi:hypothetical protein
VDKLANDYAGQPVVFLEQDVDNPLGNRYNRWWAAYGGGGSVTLPLVMVESGHQISSGHVDFYNTYKAMVDVELARPALVEIVAHSQRSGDTLQFDIQLKNLSGVPLSTFSNGATVHAIVYEDAHVGLTDRIVRAAVSTGIYPELAHGATMTFTLETGLSGVNWDKIHPLVLADYRPGGTSGAYDMLQAAFALTQTFSVQPDSLTFMIAPTDSSSPAASIRFEGPSSSSWTAVTETPWLTVTPTSGAITIQPTVSVMTSALSSGWQQGQITFTASSGSGPQLSEPVSVSAYYGPVERLYLPVVIR